MLLFIASFISLLFFVLVLVFLLYLRHKHRISLAYRLRRYQTREAKVESPTGLQFIAGLLRQITKPFERANLAKRLDYKVRQAGIPLLGSEFAFFAASSAGLAALLAGMLSLNYMIAGFTGLLVLIFWWALLHNFIRRRSNIFTEQLGDCLVTMSNALRAGNSLQRAMSLVAEKMEPPISEEFAAVERDLGLGIMLEDALEEMGRRVDNSDFDLVVTAIVIQREVGGNLAQILDNISETIHDRIHMKREINALTAQGRFSALILLLLPFGLMTLMYMTDREQVLLLINEPSGNMALGAALVLEIIGFLLIRKIIDIKL